MERRFDGFPHVIRAQQFSREWIENIFLPMADNMEGAFHHRLDRSLSGRNMISFFYQPSTRTRCSFEIAMRSLGGEICFATDNAGEFSSAKKGETLQDTIRVFNRYRPDVIVLRYNKDIGSAIAAEVSKASIINAGDREPGQHPTQALLDLRTISKRLHGIDDLSIAMVGDLSNGRTVRSLAYLLGKFRGIKIHFVSPENLRMKEDVKEYLLGKEISFFESTNLREVAPKVDVIYQTRAQTECGTTMKRRDENGGYFIVDKEVCDSMQDQAIIMHPLPRVDEIAPEVDDDHRAVYLTDQIDSGLFTRMALLKIILKGS